MSEMGQCEEVALSKTGPLCPLASDAKRVARADVTAGSCAASVAALGPSAVPALPAGECGLTTTGTAGHDGRPAADMSQPWRYFSVGPGARDSRCCLSACGYPCRCPTYSERQNAMQQVRIGKTVMRSEERRVGQEGRLADR